MHKEFAPAFTGTDGQQAANAQGKADPGRNQRGVMLAAGAQKTNQTQSNQKSRKNQRYFRHANPPFFIRSTAKIKYFPKSNPESQQESLMIQLCLWTLFIPLKQVSPAPADRPSSRAAESASPSRP